MKIGILTFHRAHNYGAVLQCYALQEVLKGMGHDVQVIDYRQPFLEKAYTPFILRNCVGNFVHVKKEAYRYLRGVPERRRRQQFFEHFTTNRLHLTAPCDASSIPQDFDVYLIGSDQLWNPICLGKKLDPVYLGEFKRPEGSTLLGYAISTPLGAFDNMGDKQLMNVVKSFHALSMREETTAKVIGCLTGITPQVCCDPTLLTDASLWNAVTNDKFKNRKYVLVYEVRWPRGDHDLLQRKAAAIASRLGCEVVTIGLGQYPVEDFVSLFKYASHVVTSSFHGTVFSLIFNRPFYSVKLKDGFDGRYENLLAALDADSQCVDMDFEPTPALVDYIKINAALKNYRAKSLTFLKQINK